MAEWDNAFKNPINFILQENEDFLLLETGDQIVLEQTGASASLWNNVNKS